MEIISVRLKGEAPLLLHNARWSVNPLSKLSKTLKEFTGKRKKTDIDLMIISKLEWIGGFYFKTFPKLDITDDDVEIISHDPPIIPASVMQATAREAAKKTRRGKDTKAGLQVLNDAIIIYKGAKNLQKMWESQDFVDIQAVTVNRAKIMRTRPIFTDWELEYQIGFDEEIFNLRDIEGFLDTAGKVIGICDYRPMYGRFTWDYAESSQKAA